MQVLKNPDTPARDRAQIQIAMSTNVGFYTDTHPLDWAHQTLSDFRSELKEHEPLQLLGVTLVDREVWLATRTEILSRSRLFPSSTVPEARGKLQRLALDFAYPTAASDYLCAMQVRSTEDLVSVLHAWYAEPDSPPADADVLVRCPTMEMGLLMFGPMIVIFCFQQPAESLEKL